jgi:hypothetical protein
MRFNREFDLNKVDETDLHIEKHDDSMRFNVWFTIDWRDEYENAFDSIRTNRESDSNEIDESDLDSEKHGEPKNPKMINANNEPNNHEWISFSQVKP